MSDYLWDKTGEAEEDVERLENLLGTLKYQPRPLEIPATAMPTVTTRPRTMTTIFSRPRFAIAASLLLALLAGTWLITRQGEPQRDKLAAADKPAETVKSEQTATAVVPNKETGNNVPANNDVQAKTGGDKAVVATVSAPKPQRVVRQYNAKRPQQLQPRRRSVVDAPVLREEIAANGTRWQVEQPMTPQQREATEQLMLALRLASAKLNYAQREMQEIGRAGK